MITDAPNQFLPYVTVISITYNQRDILALTLSDLFNQDYPLDRYNLVILDDGSTDGTGELLRAATDRSPIPLRVLSTHHESDYLTALRYNQCVAEANPETEVFIQVEDSRLRCDFIRCHADWHQSRNDVIVTGPKFEGWEVTWNLEDCPRGHLAGIGRTATRGHPFTAVWGASMSFTRRAMNRACHCPEERPFDELMTGWGYHEVEFAYRMVAAGCDVVYDPRVGVFHRHHTPQSEAKRGLDRDNLVRKGTAKNEAYLLLKHKLQALPRW